MRAIIRVTNVVTKFGDKVVHDGLDLTMNQGEIYGIIGGSGSGKTVLLKEMIMLQTPTSGDIEVLGYNLAHISYQEAQMLRKKWGVLFQFGALFSSLSVAENIEILLKEYTKIKGDMRSKIVFSKLDLVGLPRSVAKLRPSELSGGMKKRAALARALCMEPQLLFLDEPTSGLDPISAREFDRLILDLRDILGTTIVMITHDRKTTLGTVDRLAVIADKRIVAEGEIAQVKQSDHPFVQKFFAQEYSMQERRVSKGERYHVQ
jgi:phospholipid/cholesterol/gamma-HCH transport system ATP-binding protein